MKPQSTEKIDFDDIFDILDHIERKPGLFLLKPNLELLYSFISGIKLISYSENIVLKNIDKLDEFYDFVHQKLELKYVNTMSWFGAISCEYGIEVDGFNKFFEYLNEFRTE